MDEGKENLDSVLAKIDSMDRRITKMGQPIHAMQVGYDNYSGPHLTKDCDLDENGNRKAQVCYSRNNRFDEDWRRMKKEWKPYEEYRKEKKRQI